MATYKGIPLDSSLIPYLPHMPSVEAYRERLQSLQAVWDNLSLLGQLSGTTAEMSDTREAFAGLTSDLLDNLARQTLAKCQQTLAAKAQVTIDILVRNLFERTADIGFLATDGEIRLALSGSTRQHLAGRFREYVAKYSVYADVRLFDASGHCLSSLRDTNNDNTAVDEAWLHQALRSDASYQEYFGPSRLYPDSPQVLLYASRVAAGQGGVLSLRFRFEDEMQRIFGDLLDASEATVLALLDADNQVIASSDPWQLPLRAQLPIADDTLRLIRFAGRRYLARRASTQGYQGYLGPGWRGLALLPLDCAFETSAEASTDTPPDDLLAAVLGSEISFSETLRSIPHKADAIQRNLGRSVWNGTVRQNAQQGAQGNPAFSKILLREIRQTGMRMREVFSHSISELQTTVVNTQLGESAFLARLGIDIMDRNLYERANDCRWWARDPELRRLLAEPDPLRHRARIQEILAYINGLYTVYTSLVLFDASGRVMAVSNEENRDWLEQTLDAQWVSECLALRNPQAYVVSEFVPTPLYRGQASYIYAAALSSPDERRVVGGIAVVFDSTPQFQAMLADILPRDAHGEIRPGAQACFIDADNQVIASTDPARPVGSQFPLHLPATDTHKALLALDGQVLAVGCSASNGYREYKGEHDSYRNDIRAVVMLPMGEVDRASQTRTPQPAVASLHRAAGSEGAPLEIASFHVGSHWLGLPAEVVVEAVEPRDVARLSNAPPQIFGAIVLRNETVPLYNLHAALGLNPDTGSSRPLQAIIVRGPEQRQFGFLIDSLDEVYEVDRHAVSDVTRLHVGMSSVLAAIVRHEQGGPMLTLLSPEVMADCLRH